MCLRLVSFTLCFISFAILNLGWAQTNQKYLNDVLALKRKTSEVMKLTGIPFGTEIKNVNRVLLLHI